MNYDEAFPSLRGDASASFTASSVLTGENQYTPSTTSGTQGDEVAVSDIAQLIAAICNLVSQTGGRVTLGTDLFYMNPLKTIGQGASFTVKAVDQQLRCARRFDGDLQANNYFNETFAFKRLRRFPPASPEVRSRMLRMVRLEVAALSHPVLRSHENIIKLQGIGWEPCFYGSENPWPVLMVELAPYGTLADFQRNVPSLPDTLRIDLLMDIALGLEAVHISGIVHGDVKPENVLIFDHPDRKNMAKLGDFAFSRSEAEDRGFIPSGTFPWQAPEILERKSLSFDDWTLSDV
jgi:serine/threonine protein kinase